MIHPYLKRRAGLEKADDLPAAVGVRRKRIPPFDLRCNEAGIRRLLRNRRIATLRTDCGPLTQTENTLDERCDFTGEIEPSAARTKVLVVEVGVDLKRRTERARERSDRTANDERAPSLFQDAKMMFDAVPPHGAEVVYIGVISCKEIGGRKPLSRSRQRRSEVIDRSQVERRVFARTQPNRNFNRFSGICRCNHSYLGPNAAVALGQGDATPVEGCAHRKDAMDERVRCSRRYGAPLTANG